MSKRYMPKNTDEAGIYYLLSKYWVLIYTHTIVYTWLCHTHSISSTYSPYPWMHFTLHFSTTYIPVEEWNIFSTQVRSSLVDWPPTHNYMLMSLVHIRLVKTCNAKSYIYITLLLIFPILSSFTFILFIFIYLFIYFSLVSDLLHCARLGPIVFFLILSPPPPFLFCYI